jgi:mono/diheme cytochrome c family protein
MVGRARASRRAVASGLVLAGFLASQQPAASSDEAALEAGRSLFRMYCSNCHGVDGRGDGATTPYLKIAPADLTGLAARNAGRFDAEAVRRRIDGRDLVRGHGSREMPIWGLSFQDLEVDTNQESEVRIKLDRLVLFVRSIQRPDPVRSAD